ncbi:sucrose-6-phosphate hydrolase [Staphylococcus gallinarum]|uniref:Sucrose-6-phosphate hydrolase n=1 Tax=Staphylococcus gallinarum TaxID=1293 RepID=A0A380FIW1_STAGA|nr:sucrose-6-phosphate hydrolase [Staphylococcus gallinarum]
MTEWTREQRYQRIEDVDQQTIDALTEQVDASKYRQRYHIQPTTGLLNDPNGLIYFDGKYYVSQPMVSFRTRTWIKILVYIY